VPVVIFQIDDIIKNIYAAGDQTKQDKTTGDPDEDFGMKKIPRENKACEDKKIFDPLPGPHGNDDISQLGDHDFVSLGH
jgi:hypothetical protein